MIQSVFRQRMTELGKKRMRESMKRKLILLDLDGTALNDRKELTEGNRRAIEEALSFGHRVIVTTGRPLRSAKKQAERYALDGPGSLIVAYNGGIIYDPTEKKILYQSRISADTVRRVFRKARQIGVHVQTYRNEKVLVDPANDDAELRNYCRLIEMDYEVIPSIDGFTEEPAKMHSSVLEPTERLTEFRDWINRSFPEELDSFLSSPVFLEIVPHGVNKGLAVHKLAELLNWPAADIIAVGDEANDVPMIREAGLGAAMANGIAEIKAAADYITEADNNHDGVAEVIRRFALQQP